MLLRNIRREYYKNLTVEHVLNHGCLLKLCPVTIQDLLKGQNI